MRPALTTLLELLQSPGLVPVVKEERVDSRIVLSGAGRPNASQRSPPR